MVTGAIYKGFVFDGIDSKQYGVYITGQGVFDAPVRDVEMIEIPGRNGSYALDKGRFNNIEVTYPAGMFGNTDAEFMQGISDLRNALASRKGYCRLTDEYNPNEYRMAVYKSGLEVSPAQLKAGKFDITFDCKPQRFLTSGETEQTVTSGATITNPTLFESHPLLLVDGYGDFDINGEEMTIQQGAVMGDIILANSTQFNSQSVHVSLDNSKYLVGDLITVDANPSYSITIKMQSSQSDQHRFIQTITCTNIPDGYEPIIDFVPAKATLGIRKTDKTIFTAGTDSTLGQQTASFSVVIYNDITGTVITTQTVTVSLLSLDYISSNNQIGISGNSAFSSVYFTQMWQALYQPQINVDSTKSALGQLYIDLDIGECYRIENGEYISINTATTLPADLPVLNPGANTITYDNTFTSFKVTPRWWKV